MTRVSKGSVKVESVRGRLRLVWSWNHSRYFLSMGLPDTPVNRSAAEFKAKVIERDIANELFDPTLQKYKQHLGSITACDLLDKFTEHKARSVDPRTIEKYTALSKHLQSHFGKQAAELSEGNAAAFYKYLSSKMQSPTILDRMTILRAAWDWGIKQGLVKGNPWKDIKVKSTPKQGPKPFTTEEINRIREAFKTHRHYSYYADYVEFLFGTGCRTGEAVGLLWRHVADDFKSIWIGEILTRKQRKSAKNNRARIVPLTPTLQAMLKRRWGDGQPKDGYVFLSPHGLPLNPHDFRRRAWTRVLDELGIPYRKPYLTRSTLISHAIDSGMNLVEVAELVGNRVQTIYKNYAGAIRRPQLPDILSGQQTTE